MDDFVIFLKIGLYHVLDWQAYDHILFLIALTIVYSQNAWKKVLWLITFFTIGHTLTLALAAFKIIAIDIKIVEFLIPVTIIITALVNILPLRKNKKHIITSIYFLLFSLD